MTAVCMGGCLCLYIVFILIQHGNGEACRKMKRAEHYSCEGRNLTSIPSSIPSSTEELYFSFNFLPSLHKPVFPWLYGLRVLDLTRCYIQYIADNAFHNVKNVTTLILTGNPISYIGPDSINSLHKLHRLVLVDTGLSSFNIPFNNLTKLQDLNIGTNNIKSVALPVFMTNFTDFCLLDLHANNISIIKVNHTTVLREMRGNITLKLSRNPILHIEPGAFQDILLRELNIQGAFVSLNALTDGLKALSGLDVIKLTIGSYIPAISLKGVDPYYLDGLCLIKFKEIYFLQKESSYYEFHVLHCMVNATKITLKKGYLRFIENVPFHHLKELYIGKNDLSEIPKLSHLHSLEKLVIINNSPALFRGFSDMPNLQYVDLSRNQFSIKGCCSYYFKDMPKIRFINLSLNANINTDLKPFSGLELLEVLDFHHTKLDIIGKYGVLQNLKYLTYLDLSYTRLTFSSPSSFHGLNSLKVLKISGNTFQGDILSYLFSNLTVLESLDMSNSGIDHIVWTTFKDLQRLQHLFLSRNKLMVLDFLTQPNLPSLTQLAVDQNNIASIQLNTLQNIPSNLSVLDLSFNPINCLCTQTDFILWIIKNQKLFPHPYNILCKSLSPSTTLRVTDFDTQSCINIRRLKIVLSICAAIVLVSASVLVYKFQFYLRYGCIVLRGHRTAKQGEYSYDAFIIYSSKDECWVMDELVDNLENGVPPIKLCLHVRDFEAGKAITSNIIDEGILGSRKIIVVVSKHFIESSWCRFEFEMAQSLLVMQGNANIIIIILEDVEEKNIKKVFGLHKYLKKNTYLKWSRNPLNNMRFWIRLRKAVIASK
ncbi:toll-like receptor 4 [Brachyhypopomus gauderio]|uniref:toll-like receptor 4 n=1 Tax=Brachyhypopomus gauderio TaxID=698409 RepID=UPI004042651C